MCGTSRANRRHVSAEFFPVFGAQPVLGRVFRPEEDRPGGAPVVGLSHGVRVRRFGSDPNILGKPVKLNDELYTIVGVMGSGFQLHPPSDLWIPLQARAAGRQREVAVRLAIGARRGQLIRQLLV